MKKAYLYQAQKKIIYSTPAVGQHLQILMHVLLISCTVIFRWIMVVYDFNQLTKNDSGIRLQLNEAEEEFANAKSNLNAKEKNLEQIQTKRRNLLDQLEEEKNELSRLQESETTCQKKKMRAEDLVQILEKKTEYWTKKKRLIEEKEKTLTGKDTSRM